MNLQARISWLIFASAIVVLSCKPKYNIGIPKEPQDNIGAFFHDTLSLETSVVWNDSIASTLSAGAPFLMLGEYQDRYFGKLKAESYTSLFMETPSNQATSPVLDSVVMTLWPYVAQDSTTTNAAQQIEVFEIDQSQTWIPTKYYVFSEALNTKGVDLAEGRFKFAHNPSQKIKAYKAVLNKDFGNKLLSLMSGTNEDLLNLFPGIAITGKGSKMFTFRTLANDTANKITLYYKDITGRAGKQKFLFGSDSTGFYRLIHDWAGTNLSILNEGNREISTSQTQKLCYVQSGIGLYTKVKIPHLKSILKQGNIIRNVLVNKAELVVTCPDADEADVKNAYRPFLSVFELKDLNYPAIKNLLSLQVLQQSAKRVVLYYVGYNKVTKGYTFDITNYVQKSLYNNDINNGLLIGANRQRVSDNNPPYNNYLIDRAIFNDNKADKNRMKLNIYYTIVD